jgi:hypothetical protein
MPVASVGALSAFYHDTTDISDPKQRMVASFRLIGKMPTLAAMAYKYSLGQPFIYPKNELDYASNFLHMCFAVPCEDYKINPVFARALDRIFILYADHEQNPSTSTVRLAGSSGANPFACIAAGVACLWGPAHGGASEAAFKMLMEIGTVENIPKFIARAKDKNDPFRLMGFGHRVYKNYDPRAKIMQKTCHDVLNELGIKDSPLLDVAMELEKIALSDEYLNKDQFTRFLVDTLGRAAARCRDGAIAYVFMDWRHMGELLNAGEQVFSELKNLCIWNKTNGGMGTFYRSKHELIFVFKVGTAQHVNTFGLGENGRYRTNVWEFAGVNSFREGRLDDLELHPTVKPVDLVADAIRDCSRRGAIILDPFSGSGTTMGRRAEVGAACPADRI